MELANRVQALTPSSTLAITSKAKALKAEGHDVIGLGAGEPDFNTPEYILDAAKQAMDEGKTKYTPAGGLVELKDQIINKFKRDQGLEYNRNEIIVTTGAKHALYTLFQVLLNKDDEVIVPIPYWVSYPEQIKLSEGKPVFVKAEETNQFKLTPEQLEASITERTKALVLNSPSNPTGVLYTKEELEKLSQVALKYNLWIVSDEIYEKLIYGDKNHHSIAAVSKEMKERTIIINGVSKSHSMTGWRIGYAAGNEQVIKAMSNLVSHATSNPTSIAQYAAIAAYNHSEEEINKMKKAFEERLNKLYNWIVEIPNVSCVKPDGAFYLFPNVKKVVKASPFSTTDEWVEKLLDEEKVAIVPGSGFGAEDNVRLSYATSLNQLEEAAKRIKRFVEKYS
ncbi:pyridoxal phosphate-dependent aminotransferase [Filobacillus milosensis]|uniref:Aminotransferase n=1 Tax=Filobacillus milosensis TaxID=94137 RepID=A0A4Y8ITF8_9BACI|nr:pyridoxal phosphate-dependent aminotransferase [Filobacillus milosensis]TFB23991.1 pyridoxal phosphate-dependent aminotransferase [Filobacillus milosensis]